MITDAFSLGPFTVQFLYVISGLSFFMTYFLLIAFFSNAHKDFITKYYWNGVFLFFIIYKGSTVLTSPQLFIRNPLSILYFSGSRLGIYVAIFAVFIYGTLVVKRSEEISYFSYIGAFFLMMTIYLVVYYSLFTLWL